jgi:hypothetical protein
MMLKVAIIINNDNAILTRLAMSSRPGLSERAENL